MSRRIGGWPALTLAVTIAVPTGVVARSSQGVSGEISITESTQAETITRGALDALAKQIDASDAAGALMAPGVAKSLKAKVNAARNALTSGDSSSADRIVRAFVAEVSAQRDRGIAASAADALDALASAPPTVVSVSVGHASVLATEIVNSPVLLAIPDGTPIAWVRFGSSAGSAAAQLSGTRRLASIQISAFDSFGQLVTQLGSSARLSIGFEAATSVNTASARISTLDSGGRAESLATQVTNGADALTATATTTHLSPSSWTRLSQSRDRPLHVRHSARDHRDHAGERQHVRRNDARAHRKWVHQRRCGADR